MSRGAIRRAVEQAVENGGSWPCDPDGVPLYPGRERELDEGARLAIVNGGQDFALRLDHKAALRRIGTSPLWLEEGAGPNGETGWVEADLAAWGDVVLARKDVPASYHLSCVIDDALQGVSNVVRGRDLFHSTSVHRALQELFGLPAPAYFHHDLIVDEAGRKLSKSVQSTALRHLREAGMTPGDIRRMIGLDG